MATGKPYEDLAARHLSQAGMSILARNYRSKSGEIDIIGQLHDRLVFVEVRYRSNHRFASAAQSVTRAKQRRIIRTAQYYLQRHWRGAEPACRFDVIAIEPGINPHETEVQWLQNAFTL
jgi:putative endonuclease